MGYRGLRSLSVLIALSGIVLLPLSAQPVEYRVTQVTTGSTNHEWPSIDTASDIVWSQQESGACGPANLCWQVFELSKSSATQKTSDAHNHQYPSIGDNGSIMYLKDGTGAGPGLEVALLTGATRIVG